MALEVAKGILRVAQGSTPAEELNFRPRALVLWWCRERGGGCAGGIGFATDGGGDASTAWAADDALAPGVLSRLGAETPLLLHGDPRTPDVSSRGRVRFADRGFSVECDHHPEHQWLVHYLALGGSDLHRASVRDLMLDSTGRRAVTGLGFEPAVVLAAVGAGSKAGEPRSGLAVGFGAAALSSNQVASGFVSQADAGGTIARGAQFANAIAVLPAAAASGEIAALSRLVSCDQDGFTLETTNLASELPLAVLALEGGSYTVGTGSASSRATAVGFPAGGALLFGTGLNATSHARDIGRLCVGAFSRAQRAGCVSWSTLRRGAWPPEPRSRSTAEAVFEVIDTTSGDLHARATLASLGRRRFRLSWPVLESPPRDFGYVAFGAERRKATLRDRLRPLDRHGSFRE
jgi:hypothetical protein